MLSFGFLPSEVELLLLAAAADGAVPSMRASRSAMDFLLPVVLVVAGAGGGAAAPASARRAAASAASCLSIAFFIREGISWLGEHRPSGGVEATGGNDTAAGAIICIRRSAAAASWACCLSRAARIAS